MGEGVDADVFEHLRRILRVTLAVFRSARDAQLPFLAAAIAYYAFLSLVPLLALALVLAAAVGGEAFLDRLLDRSTAFLTPETRDALDEALTRGTQRVGAAGVGTVVLAWSALKVLRALHTAFGTVYGTSGEESFAAALRDGVVVTGAVGLGTVVLGAILVGVASLPLGVIAAPVVLLLGVGSLTVLFVPLYYVMPDRAMSVGAAAPGAVVAAIGWTLLGASLSLYVEFAAGVAVYGLLGGIVLLLTALYAGAMVVLLGAVCNAVLVADRQVQQDRSADLDLNATMPADRDEESAGDDAEIPFQPGDAGPDATEDTAGGSGADGGGASAAEVGPEAAEFDPGGRTRAEQELRAEIEDLRAELAEHREAVDERTVHRDEVERDLKRYVRRRVRRGHARGWGPYVVLLYGVVMTVGAFHFLSGGWAVLAMIVAWLSTLGLYVVMVLVNAGLSLLGIPGRIRNRIGEWRS